MRLHIIAIGRMRRGAEQELIDDYSARLARGARPLGLSGPQIVELDESRDQNVDKRRQDEATRLLAAVPDDALIVALDGRGKSLTSEALADGIGSWRDDGVRDLAFLIGGPDGHGPEIAERADLALALGAATWPHMLVRVMILEQIYRAATILSGHPYHRA